MKVGVYLGSEVNPSIGGNFSYHEKFISTIDTYHFDKQLEICFVGRGSRRKIKLQKEYFTLAPWIVYKLFRAFERIYITHFLSKLLFTNSDICNRIDCSLLRKNGVDLLLFPKQFLRDVKNFPFISMNWDAGHKSTFAFPELLENFVFRERWYRVEIQEAIAIFVESQSSKEEFINYYSIPDNKIEIIPLFPGGVVDLIVDGIRQIEILKELKLEPLSYFYYPAQFWAHKNHYNLILAFKKLISENQVRNLKLVFTGSDMGNKDYINSFIKEQGLGQQVMALDFVSNETVHSLYKNAMALTMPTFLGPTNMPLLEAQFLQTAILCSDFIGHREICGDGALYANPAVVDQWYQAMAALLDDKFRKDLIRKADRVRGESVFNIQHAIKKLEQALIKFVPIRKTFK